MKAVKPALSTAISWRILQAKKPETRARRIEQFVKLLSEGKKLH